MGVPQRARALHGSHRPLTPVGRTLSRLGPQRMDPNGYIQVAVPDCGFSVNGGTGARLHRRGEIFPQNKSKACLTRAEQVVEGMEI